MKNELKSDTKNELKSDTSNLTLLTAMNNRKNQMTNPNNLKLNNLLSTVKNMTNPNNLKLNNFLSTVKNMTSPNNLKLNNLKLNLKLNNLLSTVKNMTNPIKTIQAALPLSLIATVFVAFLTMTNIGQAQAASTIDPAAREDFPDAVSYLLEDSNGNTITSHNGDGSVITLFVTTEPTDAFLNTTEKLPASPQATLGTTIGGTLSKGHGFPFTPTANLTEAIVIDFLEGAFFTTTGSGVNVLSVDSQAFTITIPYVAPPTVTAVAFTDSIMGMPVLTNDVGGGLVASITFSENITLSGSGSISYSAGVQDLTSTGGIRVESDNVLIVPFLAFVTTAATITVPDGYVTAGGAGNASFEVVLRGAGGAATMCSALPDLTNGSVTYAPGSVSDYEVGTVATYACNLNYALDTSAEGSAQTRMCRDDFNGDAFGVFSNAAPMCRINLVPMVDEAATTDLDAYVTSTNAIPITVTFSEAVKNFANTIGSSKITTTNARVSAIAIRGTPTSMVGTAAFASVYDFTLSPIAEGTFGFAVKANVALDTDDNGNTAGRANTAILDSIAPTARISGFSSSVNTTAAFAITISFAEVVTFDGGSFNVLPFSASISPFSVQDNVYAATVTPANNLAAAAGIIINITPGEVIDLAGNTNVFTEAKSTFNPVLPNVFSITAADSYTDSTLAIPVTVTFDRPPSPARPFVISDIDIRSGFGPALDNPNITNLTVTSNPLEYTFDITPPRPLNDINISIGSRVNTITYIARLPGITGITAAADYDSTAPIEVTVTFANAPGRDFAPSDVLVNSIPADATNVTAITISGNEYRFNLTPPTPLGDITISINTLSTMTHNITYNIPAGLARPTVTLNAYPATMYNTTAPVAIVATFNRAVTNFDEEDIAAINTASTNVEVTNITANSDTRYTLMVAPSADIADRFGEDHSLTLTLMIPADLAQAVTDSQDNTASLPVSTTFDNIKPVFSLSAPLPVYITSTSEFAVIPSPAINLSEPTITRLVDSDVQVVGLQSTFILNPLTDIFYQLTFRATGDVQGEVSATIPANTVFDNFGNGNEEARFTSIFDNILPFPTLTGVPAIRTTTTTGFDVTATFNEVVTGFTSSDISVGSNTTATLENFTDQGDGLNYTFRVNPNEANPGDITITIPAAAVQDAAGNANSAFAQTSRFDDTPPTVELRDVPMRNSTRAFEVTAVFSEPVDGFITGDATSGNANITITAVNTGAFFTDIYTLNVVPTSTGDVTITIPANAAQDEANLSNDTGASATSAYDTTPPTASFEGFPATITTTVTAVGAVIVRFDKVVNYDASDLTVSTNNATLSGFTDNGDNSYTYSLTPNQGLATGDLITLNIAAGAVTDLAGNATTAITATTTFIIVDTINPTITTTTGLPTHVNSTNAIPITITFSEEVTGFADADANSGNIARTNATISAIAVSGTSRVIAGETYATAYSFTLKPTAEGTFGFSVNANAAQDVGGLNNTVGQSNSAIYDNTPPTIDSIDGLIETITTTLPFNITVNFDEAVTGLDAGDLTTDDANATFSNFTGSGASYEVTVTPSPTLANRGMITLNIAAGAVTDLAGNPNAAAELGTTMFLPVLPVVTNITPDETTFNTTAMIGVTVTFATLPSTARPFESVDINAPFSTITDLAVNTGNSLEYSFNLTPTMSLADIIVTINGVSTTITFQAPVDTTAPTVAFNTNLPTYVNNDTTLPFPIIVTFSERVRGFDSSDVNPSNATIADFTSVSDSVSMVDGVTYASSYSFTINPSQGEFSVSVNANAAQDLGNNGNTNMIEQTSTYDSIAPTGIHAPVSINTTAPFNVTVDFGETVTGFATGDLTVSTSNAAAVLTGSSNPYTVRITPSGNFAHQDIITLNIAADAVTDSAGNANAAAVLGTTTFIDNIRPTVVIAAQDTYNSTSPFAVTVTFGENITGFVASDVTVSPAGTNVTASGSGSDYTLMVTPNAGSRADITLSIAANRVQDAAGNGNTASNNDVEIQYLDTVRPSVRLGVVATHSGNAFSVTVTFNETVTGFDESDVSITNATFTIVGGGTGSGSIYFLNVTPAGITDITLSIAADRVNDLANSPNTNTASNVLMIAYMEGPDIVPPSVTSFRRTDSTTDHDGSAFDVTAVFSEAVADFTPSDLAVVGGTPSAITDSGDSITYTFTVTPSGSGTADIRITLPANTVQDTAAAPNRNTAAFSTPTIRYVDTTPPTVTLSAPLPVANEHNGSPFTVTATFSEPVTELIASDLNTSGGTVSNFSGSGARYTFTFTPITTTPTNLSIAIPAATVQDMSAVPNDNTASNTLTINAETSVPTVTLSATLPVANEHNGVPFNVTASFSKPVTGFTASDLTVTGVTTAATISGSGANYTIRVTPNVRDTGDITLMLPENSVKDSVGNDNTASLTLTITAESTVPTVTSLSRTDNATQHDGTPFDVAVIFSEVVFGFDDVSTDLTLTGVTTAATISGSGANYSIRITPNIGENGNDPITIAIPANMVEDVVGNANTASADTLTITYNTVPPALTTESQETLTLDQTGTDDISVPMTFNKPVTLAVPSANVIDRFTITNGKFQSFEPVTPSAVQNRGDSAITVPSPNFESGGNTYAKTYMLTITPTLPDAALSNAPSTLPISITLAADTVLDTAGMNNVEITKAVTLNLGPTDEEVQTATREAISSFLLSRTSKLASNQPGLTRFIQGNDSASYNANASQNAGSAAGFIVRGDTWVDVGGSWASGNSYALGTLGAHRFLTPSTLVGGMVQYDSITDDTNDASGKGWLIGPYFASKIPNQNYYIEGRALFGQSDNELTVTVEEHAFKNEFDSERWLVQTRATGEYQYGGSTLMPLIDLTYTSDTWDTFDTRGITNASRSIIINGQRVSTTALSAGMDFTLPIAVSRGGLNLIGGLSGIYSANTGGVAASDDGRGRAKLGINYDGGKGITLGIGTFYDGIGSDYEGYGANLRLGIRF